MRSAVLTSAKAADIANVTRGLGRHCRWVRSVTAVSTSSVAERIRRVSRIARQHRLDAREF
jgi:hypothetical protein